MSIRDFIETNQLARQINDNGASNLETNLTGFYNDHEEEIWEELIQTSCNDVIGFLAHQAQGFEILCMSDMKAVIAMAVLEDMAEKMIYEMDNPDCEEEANE